MKNALLILSVLVVLGVRNASAQNTPLAYDVPEAYAVYSAIVANEWPIRVAKAQRLVIQAETIDYPDLPKDEKICLVPTNDEKSLYDPVIAEYVAVNKKTWLLQRKFEIGIPYEFISKAEISAIFEKKGMEGWTDLRAKHPDSGGIISMSAVGFNADKTIAIVYMGHSCGGLCGGGIYHVLKKVDGKWGEIIWLGISCMWSS
jgi:hypothetical protein